MRTNGKRNDQLVLLHCALNAAVVVSENVWECMYVCVSMLLSFIFVCSLYSHNIFALSLPSLFLIIFLSVYLYDMPLLYMKRIFWSGFFDWFQRAMRFRFVDSRSRVSTSFFNSLQHFSFIFSLPPPPCVPLLFHVIGSVPINMTLTAKARVKVLGECQPQQFNNNNNNNTNSLCIPYIIYTTHAHPQFSY